MRMIYIPADRIAYMTKKPLPAFEWDLNRLKEWQRIILEKEKRHRQHGEQLSEKSTPSPSSTRHVVVLVPCPLFARTYVRALNLGSGSGAYSVDHLSCDVRS